jgi:hypothetical protein
MESGVSIFCVEILSLNVQQTSIKHFGELQVNLNKIIICHKDTKPQSLTKLVIFLSKSIVCTLGESIGQAL